MAQPIAVQLYTLRDAAANDIRPVLERLGAKGYAGVETAGLQGLSGLEFADALRNSGLALASAHIGYEGRDAFRAALDAHAPLAPDTVVIPFAAPDEFKTVDGIAKLASRINRANAIANEYGLTLGYHNHFWELQISHNNRVALLHLFDQLETSVIAEVDIYWARVGGTDPLQLVTELGPRVTRLHVKDGPAVSHDQPMVAVGDGVIDVPAVLAANPSVQWHIVELDSCATDMFDAVERSYDYLVGSGLSTGQR